jgi:hypothetical protein
VIKSTDLKDIEPQQLGGASAQHVDVGLPIPKVSRLELFSPDDLEGFIEEWASSLKSKYAIVKRFSGAGDKGIDIAAFHKGPQFQNGWDNYQCKQYDHALHPSDAWLEIGKVIYFTFLQEYPPPQKYFFVASKGIGTTLSRLFSDASELKAECQKNWNQYCRTKLTATKPDVPPRGSLARSF